MEIFLILGLLAIALGLWPRRISTTGVLAPVEEVTIRAYLLFGGTLLVVFSIGYLTGLWGW